MTYQPAEDDDVDSLFAAYEAQAAADRAETEQKLHKHSQKPHKSMREIRDDGLAVPIASDNKYGARAAASFLLCEQFLPP
ncbi:hypothetical protein ABBQ38_003443 [Trebouxia sp. C0009 RCD-2024]